MNKQTEVTRRDFLKTAMAAAVAVTGVESASGAPAILSVTSPNSLVHYGFIGTGTEGCDLLKHLTTIPDGRCIATCDIYPPNLKKGAETIGSNPDPYPHDYRRLLERKDLDAILIATPLNLHAQMVIDSLDSGRHVFVEKTMYFEEAEGDRIRKAVEANPKQLFQIGLQRRSSGLYRAAMEMIRKGALGKVMFIRANWHRNNNWRRPVRDPHYERLINWRLYREYSGGLMAELGSHQVDVANWVFGAEPASVVGLGGIDYWKDGRETNDNVEAVFEYPGGRKLAYSSILCNAHYGFEEQIMGDQGTLETTLGKVIYYRETVPHVSPGPAKENWLAGATVLKEAGQKGIVLFPKGGVEGAETSKDKQEAEYVRRWLATQGIEFEEPRDPKWSELSNFFASIREGKPIVCPLDVGMADAKAVLYSNRAIDTGQKVFWPKTGA
jgi:predicted dehydrogenase